MLTGFFQPSRSQTPDAVALHEITSIGSLIEPAKGAAYQLIHLRGGDDASVRAYPAEVEALMKRPAQLLPAEPGSKLLYVGFDEDSPWVMRTPLIAWALCLDGFIRPVSPAGVDDGDLSPEYGWFVEFPSGGIHTVGEGESFQTEAELLAGIVRQKAQREEFDRSREETK